MWKAIKFFFKMCLLIVFITCGFYIYSGYRLYNEAIIDMPISVMAQDIKEKENYTELSDMTKTYKEAVVAVEDHRFYYHDGVDIISITRAIINDIKAMAFVEGGSTITQQLAKNTYFTQEKKLTRKIAEVFMAAEIEKECTKDEILELYLNSCYFGDGCYTVSEASRHYFNKEPIDMTDYESTMLAGIPNAPSVYAPTKNPKLAKQRQRQVLDKMVEYGKMNLEYANEILQITYAE
mgnify:CR=1 FL=1